jgi:hypothetical protein
MMVVEVQEVSCCFGPNKAGLLYYFEVNMYKYTQTYQFWKWVDINGKRWNKELRKCQSYAEIYAKAIQKYVHDSFLHMTHA